MKIPQTFMPENSLDAKTDQLLKEPKLLQPDEKYKVEIERIIRKNDEHYDFLLTDSEIIGLLEKLPANDIEGLGKIVIQVPSKNERYKLFGRYEKGVKISEKYMAGKIYLFKHLKKEGKFEIELGLQPDGSYETKKFTPEEFKVKNYVALLHEIGHHVGIKDFSNESEEFAKDYVANKYINIPGI